MFNLRRYFLLDPSIIFLNHGSFGATPRPVFRAYQRWQRELERQPVEFLGRRHNDLIAAARAELAAYLGTSPETLVYTTNVTVALNIVARSLDLGPGDEVLATDHEYGALDRTWRFLAAKRGFVYRRQPIPVPLTTPATFLDVLWQGVTPRTRVIFLSHITSPTALIFPVETVIRRARREGILTVIDGAHAPGQIPLHLDELGADFYGGNLHKWLCAPKGAGFLYARPEVQHLLEPLVVSWGWEAEVPGPSRLVEYHEWQGTRDIAAFLAVPEAIRFQHEHNWPRVRAACHDLARRALAGICALTGLPALSDERWFGQFVSIPLPESVDPVVLKHRLYHDYRIEAPFLAWNEHKLLRVSFQGYNSERDLRALLQAMQKLLAA
ncbi:MAG: aminotransferase class V-fold PLP-dependent enzyme [Anaerolineales bacterium]|nr:aminotransferase class V-fold PLP-dependent enzyme [Anaerolineales bacterium]